jgi:MarR family transcriptional regulator, transcriptional regulator for hemolysin
MELSTIIPFVIEQTSALAKQNSQKEFDAAKIPITVDQWILLKAIDEKPGLTQVELAEKIYRSASSLARTLDALDKKGLIKRERVPNNRKQYTIRLTTEGNHLVLKSTPIVENTIAKGLLKFSKKDIEQLKSLLLRIQKNYLEDATKSNRLAKQIKKFHPLVNVNQIMRTDHPLLKCSIIVIALLMTFNALGFQTQTQNPEKTMAKTNKDEVLNNYKALFAFKDGEPFPERTLKTYCIYLLDGYKALHEEVTLHTKNLQSNSFDNFYRNQTRAEEAVKEAKEGNLVKNIAEFEMAIKQLGAEFKALEVRYDNNRNLERTIELLDRVIRNIDGGGLEEAEKTLANAKATNPDFDFKTYDVKIAEYVKESKKQEILTNASKDLEQALENGVRLCRGILNGDNFITACETLDYPALVKKVKGIKKEELKGFYEGEKRANYLLEEFLPAFEQYIKNVYTAKINQQIEEAYKGRGAANNASFIKIAEHAVAMVDAALSVTPAAVGLKKLQKDATGALDKLSAEAEAKSSAAYTSEFHKKNKNRLVFSTKRLIPKKEKDSTVSTSFEKGQPIYARAYFTNKMINLQGYESDQLVIILKYYIDPPAQDGNGNTWHNISPSLETSYHFPSAHIAEGAIKIDDSTLEIDIAPDPSQTVTPGQAAKVSKFLGEISPRNHSIGVAVYLGVNKLMMTGTFDIDCSDGQDNYTALVKPLEEAQVAINRPPVSKGIIDPALEKQILAALKKNGANVLRVIQTYPGFEIVHHKLSGAIEYRWMQTTAVHKAKDNTHYVQDVILRQDYEGSYQPLRVTSWEIGEYQILAKNVNK